MNHKEFILSADISEFIVGNIDNFSDTDRENNISFIIDLSSSESETVAECNSGLGENPQHLLT
jgi:hypothetical protein